MHRFSSFGAVVLVSVVGCSNSANHGDPAGQGGAIEGMAGASARGGAATGASSGRTTASVNGGADANAGGSSSVGNSGSAGTAPVSSSSGGTPATGATSNNGGATVARGGTNNPGVGGNAALGGVAGRASGGTSSHANAGRTSTTGGRASGGGAGQSASSTGGRNSGGAAGVATGGSSTVAIGGAAVAGAPSYTDVPTGNPDGHCAVPAEAALEDVSAATQIVGNGTAASCTGDAVVAAVWNGGKPVNRVRFDCGPDPVTIVLTDTIRVPNAASGASTLIDGGGKVTLSGGGKVRILYANACNNALGPYTDHCQNQDSPHVTVQNLTFIDGNAAAVVKSDVDEPGGGAIWMRGGRLKIINSRFFRNACASTGQDIGGAAVRALSQYQGLPIYVVNSTFGGKSGLGNSGSNGGGLSSIGVSWTIINSLFSYNFATGNGGNPAATGTPGGGSGGAIYNDGNEMTLSICGTLIENNTVKAYGGAIFFVSNNHTGTMNITDSVLRHNPGGSWYPTYPGISNHDDTPITVTNSTITE
jgi:hypothetical protein